MPSRCCWSCERDVHITPLTDAHPLTPEGSKWDGSWTAAGRCDFCGAISIASFTAPGAKELARASNATMAFRGVHGYEITEISWQPRGGAIVRKVVDVPHGIDEAAGEAIAALNIGAYKAAILMSRAVLEATAKDHGVTTGTLAAKIDALHTQGVINATTSEAAHEIRHLGNDMAHGDFTQDTVTENDAREVVELTEAILEEIYRRPARIARLREKRLEQQRRDDRTR